MKIKYSIVGKLFRQLKVGFKKLLHLRDSTHEIALGFAVGVFVGVFPTFGFGALVLGALAIVIRFNFVASLIGTLINNPLFTPFWLISSYKVGELVTKAGIKINEDFLKNTFNFTLSYLVGNIILSVVSGIISYFVVYIVVESYRASKREDTKEK